VLKLPTEYFDANKKATHICGLAQKGGTAMSTPEINEDVITAGQMCKMLNMFIQHGVTRDILQERILGTGILSDIAKAAVRGTLPDRKTFQQFLSLESGSVPQPSSTKTCWWWYLTP